MKKLAGLFVYGFALATLITMMFAEGSSFIS